MLEPTFLDLEAETGYGDEDGGFQLLLRLLTLLFSDFRFHCDSLSCTNTNTNFEQNWKIMFLDLETETASENETEGMLLLSTRVTLLVCRNTLKVPFSLMRQHKHDF